MESESWPCVIWNINNFYSVKEQEHPQFCVKGNTFSLILEQNCFKISSKDCFTVRIKKKAQTKYNPNLRANQNYCDWNFSDFPVSTFIKCNNGSVLFVQNTLVQNNKFVDHCCIIWNVPKKAIISVMDILPPEKFEISIVFGPVSNYFMLLKDETEKIKRTNLDDVSIQTSSKSADFASLESLSHDMNKLLNNEIETDITIKCEESSFAVHKSILSARSSVFAAMFRNDMTERNSRRIEITDIEPAVMKMFLQYIYSGTMTEVTDNTAPLLYSASHKYMVSVLQKRCADYLMEIISENNACKLLLLADEHEDDYLKSHVKAFIIKNDKIMSEDEWLKLSDENPKLSNEVYREYVKDVSSKKKL